MKYLATLFFLFSILSSDYLQAQCYPDRHNTSLDAGWLSCRLSTNPNPNRPSGYWIMYELEERQAVSSLKVWNINHPDHIRSGVRTLEVDYINPDGSWSNHSIHQINRAEASGFYEGQEIDLPGEFVTDKILLNLTSSHGGGCRGLAEVRFGLINKTTSTYDIAQDHFDIQISPNPFMEVANVTVQQLEGKTIQYQVINNLGQLITSDNALTQKGSTTFQIQRGNMPSGTYFLKIIDGNKISTRRLSITSN